MFNNHFNSLLYLQSSDTPVVVPDMEETYISTYQGKRVYLKREFSIHELIGEEIANFMERDSIHYFLLKKNGITKLASFPIIERAECYPDDLKFDILFQEKEFDGDDRYENYIPFFLNQSKDQFAKEKLLTDLYKTFAIDAYMRQTDRCSCNCMMYQDEENLFWAPMYDYADSFKAFRDIQSEFNNYFYDNPFFIMNLDDYSDFLGLYPEFLNYLKQIQKVDLLKVLDNIRDKYCFRYSLEFLDYWKRQEELSQSILRKIIR